MLFPFRPNPSSASTVVETHRAPGCRAGAHQTTLAPSHRHENRSGCVDVPQKRTDIGVGGPERHRSCDCGHTAPSPGADAICLSVCCENPSVFPDTPQRNTPRLKVITRTTLARARALNFSDVQYGITSCVCQRVRRNRHWRPRHRQFAIETIGHRDCLVRRHVEDQIQGNSRSLSRCVCVRVRRVVQRVRHRQRMAAPGVMRQVQLGDVPAGIGENPGRDARRDDGALSVCVRSGR